MSSNIFFLSFLPEFFLSFAVLAQLLFNSYYASNIKFNFTLMHKEIFIQIIFILLCIGLFLNSSKIECSGFCSLFENNSDIYSLKFILICLSLIVFIPIWRGFLIEKLNLYEYFVMFLLYLLSSLFLISASDLLSIYLVMELQTLCTFVLIAFKRSSAFSTEVSLKYFVTAAVMSSLFLLGCVLIYGSLGTLNLNVIELLLAFPYNFSNKYLLIFILTGFFLILSTFFFKISSVPFHFSVVDAYDGAPFSSTVLLNTLAKLIYFIIIIKLLTAGLFFLTELKYFFFFVGVLSSLIGTFLGLYQKKLKRLLIYSSVAQVGLLLCTLGAFSYNSVLGVLFYLIFYIIISSGVWTILGLIYNSRKIFYESLNKNKENISLNITSFTNLYLNHSLLALVLGFCLFSFGGFPPFIGFIMKFLVLKPIIANTYYFLGVLLVVINVIGAFYYIRLIKVLFFEPTKKKLISDIILLPQTNDTFDYISIAFSFFIASFIMLFVFFIPINLLNIF